MLHTLWITAHVAHEHIKVQPRMYKYNVFILQKQLAHPSLTSQNQLRRTWTKASHPPVHQKALLRPNQAGCCLYAISLVVGTISAFFLNTAYGFPITELNANQQLHLITQITLFQGCQLIKMNHILCINRNYSEPAVNCSYTYILFSKCAFWIIIKWMSLLTCSSLVLIFSLTLFFTWIFHTFVWQINRICLCELLLFQSFKIDWVNAVPALKKCYDVNQIELWTVMH